MARQSAGILLYRLHNQQPEVFLVHPGGPFWAGKDLHAWSIPKGEFNSDEDSLDAARREFKEETGNPVSGDFIELSPVKQKGGKIVYCYACEGDIDPKQVKSNTFEMEWPPRSGKKQVFTEIDSGEWFDTSNAKLKILESQAVFIDELLLKLDSGKKIR